MNAPRRERRASAPPRVRRGSAVPDSPAVSIIVLVTARVDRLVQCLASISAHADADPVAEILVLANGTSPANLVPLDDREDIVLIRSAVNHGFGAGCNWAARFARGSRLVFINDDAVATAGWLAALSGAMDDDPRTGVVGSRVLLTDGRLQEAGNVVWRDGSTSHLGRGLRADEPDLLARRDVDYVSFCSAMVRREAWDQVGGFDERFFPAYYEDVDLCLSLRELGWRVVCEPASVVVHEEGASTPVRLRQFLSRRNQRRFVVKWGAALASLPEPPSPLTARAVMAAASGFHSRSSTHAESRLDARAATPRVRTGDVSEREAVLTELRHSNDDRALKEEYIAALTAELDGYGAITLARKRGLAIRRGIALRVRRRPGLSRLADWVLGHSRRRQ
jgi:GT2 family glycosyltransferase